MCDFCRKGGGGTIKDEYGQYKLDLVEVTPLPAIDLTTGKMDSSAESPFYELFLRWDEEQEESSGEIGAFQIRFCPLCGAELLPTAEACDLRDKAIEILSLS